MTETVEDELNDEPRIALYNKYRPRRFSDLVGQDMSTDALRKSVQEGRTSHGYLFSGPRGTGKTTSARILAAALNCPNVEEGEPCGECDICISTFNGTFAGAVNELNATDQRGIDDVRQLLSSIEMSVMANYKVYIIDEVHQLTREASSLLLKMLEEPPSPRVRFILATTDPDKLLDTIRSRLVQVNFRLIDNDTLTELVSTIAEKEGIEAEEHEIANTVAAGRGSARDAISALERVAMGLSNDNMGITNQILDGILNENLSEILVAIAHAESEGELNSRNIAEDILTFWRDVLVYQQSPELVTAVSTYRDLVDKGAEYQRKRIIRNFEATSEMLSTMRTAGSNRIALEGGIARMMTPMPSVKRLDAILDRLESIEQKLNKPMVATSSENGVDQDNPWGEIDPDDATAEWPSRDSVRQGDTHDESDEDEEEREERPRRSSRPRRGTGRRSNARRRPTRGSSSSRSRDDNDEEEEETPKRRTRPASRRRGSRQTSQDAPSEPDDDSIEESSEQETSSSGGSNQETTEEEDKLFEQVLEAVSGRSRALIQEGSYGTNDDGIFTLYTDRRIVARTQENIIDTLGIDVQFEVMQ